jgi:hypothetical protein
LTFKPEEPYHTGFNYVDRALSLGVLPISQLLASRIPPEDRARARHEIGRLARSTGRMLADIADGGFGRAIYCPMLISDPKICQALPRLAKDKVAGNIV